MTATAEPAALHLYLKGRTLRALLALAALCEADAPLYQAELAGRLRDDPASLGRALRHLEEDGLVEVRAEGGDPRELGRPLRRYYTPTERGRAFVRDLGQLVRVKGPLDATPLNPEYSPYLPLGRQVSTHDYTYTAPGPDPEELCAFVWEAVEPLRGEGRGDGYELWTREGASIRVRTNAWRTLKLFARLEARALAEYRSRG